MSKWSISSFSLHKVLSCSLPSPPFSRKEESAGACALRDLSFICFVVFTFYPGFKFPLWEIGGDSHFLPPFWLRGEKKRKGFFVWRKLFLLPSVSGFGKGFSKKWHTFDSILVFLNRIKPFQEIEIHTEDIRALLASFSCAEQGCTSFCLRQIAVGHTAVAKLPSGHCAVVSNCRHDILQSCF